jgi:hypothetical protein
MRGVSNGFGFAGCVRFIRESIELPSLNVALDLTIPRLPVKRQEPVSKLCKLLRRQSLDLVLDSFNFAHDTSLALPSETPRSPASRVQPASAAHQVQRIVWIGITEHSTPHQGSSRKCWRIL